MPHCRIIWYVATAFGVLSANGIRRQVIIKVLTLDDRSINLGAVGDPVYV